MLGRGEGSSPAMLATARPSCSIFDDGSCLPLWFVGCLFAPLTKFTGGLYCYAEFDLDRCSSYVIWSLYFVCLETPVHAHAIVFWGFDSLNEEYYQLNLKKAHSCMSLHHVRHHCKNPSMGLTCSSPKMSGNNQKIVTRFYVVDMIRYTVNYLYCTQRNQLNLNHSVLETKKQELIN